MTNDQAVVAIVRESLRIEEDATYSAKGHFAAAEAWDRFHIVVGLPTAVLAAVAAGFALRNFAHGATIAGYLALVVAALTAITTFLNSRERAGAHLAAANRYQSLRNRTRVFREVDCASNGSVTDLREQLEGLGGERDRLNQDSPKIPGWAYSRAKSAIQAGEASYEVEDERTGRLPEPP